MRPGHETPPPAHATTRAADKRHHPGVGRRRDRALPDARPAVTASERAGRCPPVAHWQSSWFSHQRVAGSTPAWTTPDPGKGTTRLRSETKHDRFGTAPPPCRSGGRCERATPAHETVRRIAKASAPSRACERLRMTPPPDRPPACGAAARGAPDVRRNVIRRMLQLFDSATGGARRSERSRASPPGAPPRVRQTARATERPGLCLTDPTPT